MSRNKLRKCLVCEKESQMNTWINNNSAPQLIALILLFFFFLPGVIFIAINWGKYKCPICNAVGKNIPVEPVEKEYRY
jgi:hypothetical protein